MRIFLLCIFLSGSCLVSAQNSTPWSLGAFTGVSLANASIKNGIPGDYHTKYGFNAGVFLDYSFQNRFSIQTQLGFLQSGYQISYQDNLSVNRNQNIVEFENSYTGYDFVYGYNNFVNSWLIGYTFGRKYSIKPQIGLFGGINLGTNTESINYIYIDPEDHEVIGDPSLPIGYLENLEEGKVYKESFTAYQFGIVSNLVLAYQIDEQYRFFLSSGFYLDLINSGSDTQLTGFEQYFRTFTINIGIAMDLGQNKTGS